MKKMENSALFKKNLFAISGKDPSLAALLLKTEANKKLYTFPQSRTGEKIPAFIEQDGKERPLHSMMDPRKEASRLIDSSDYSSGERSSGEHCFLILLGLGSGHYAEAALKRKDVSKVLVIEYDINGLAQLFNQLDYTDLFSDSRFSLLVDLSESELNRIILDLYQPVLCGNIRVIPLRPRITHDALQFSMAVRVIESAIAKISADYSVQAHFGKRWFGNIIRNLNGIKDISDLVLPSAEKVTVCAAGPSLLIQMEQLKEKRQERFLIATDTSLPCLLKNEITPDAVISIDCQHISYYHFMEGLPSRIPLFLDLASPPLLSSLSPNHHFVSCGHPLTNYISGIYGKIPDLDSSGGNVTYAAVSLAEMLGAAEIEIYGADFSYPLGISYAKGTYIYTFFEKKANRFSPIEAQASAFLFRTPLDKKGQANSWYYETKTLKFYREKLEEKSKTIEVSVIPVKGMGAQICVTGKEKTSFRVKKSKIGKTESSQNASYKSKEFLLKYRDDINSLPMPGNNPMDYLYSLNAEKLAVFTTLLPLAAAFKYRKPALSFRELIEEVKSFCVKEINLIQKI